LTLVGKLQGRLSAQDETLDAGVVVEVIMKAGYRLSGELGDEDMEHVCELEVLCISRRRGVDMLAFVVDELLE
jgi:hypothetical protein